MIEPDHDELFLTFVSQNLEAAAHQRKRIEVMANERGNREWLDGRSSGASA
jgi:hypothetical protein